MTHLDDPRHDVTAREFRLAHDLPVHVNGAELHRVSACVEDAIADISPLEEDEDFGSELVGITFALIEVQKFLQKLASEFEAAAGNGGAQ
jgi:hypothetical protein